MNTTQARNRAEATRKAHAYAAELKDLAQRLTDAADQAARDAQEHGANWGDVGSLAEARIRALRAVDMAGGELTADENDEIENA